MKNISNDTSTVMGGSWWAKIPQPYRFLHPTPVEKRKVRVEVTRYYGVGVHFYATVEERPNYVWDGETWRQPWAAGGFPDLDGKRFSGRFDTYTEAVNFVNTRIAENFSPTTHELYDSSGFGKIENFQWFFADDFDPNEGKPC